MKLRYSPTSPYVRKVSVVAIETGLDDRIERARTDPWAEDSDLGDDNPLGKIPALTTDGGEVLFDSQLICEYLDSLHDGRKLFPLAGGARWRALRLMVLADGTTEAARLQKVELRRPEADRSEWWMERQKLFTRRGLDSLENGVVDFDADLTIGHVAVGCLLGWLDLRFPSTDWRPARPWLADWYGEFSQRPSMLRTAPVDDPPAT